MGIRFYWPGVMDGSINVFEQGVDFSCSLKKFQAYLHSRAKQKGMTVTTTKINEVKLTAQFHISKAELMKQRAEKLKNRRSPSDSDDVTDYTEST